MSHLTVQPAQQGDAPGATVGWFNLSGGLDVTVRAVFREEPCYYLGEFILPSKSGKSRSRYQLLRIVRADRLVTAYVYLGPAAKFLADEFQMLGGVVENGRGQVFHTVAELQDGADEIRGRKLLRELEPLPLQNLFMGMVEQKKAVRRAVRTGELIA